MALDFLDSLFDTDGDGKLTIFDGVLDYMICEDVTKDLYSDTSYSDDDWRSRALDASAYGIYPEDYDNILDYYGAYLNALEEVLSQDEEVIKSNNEKYDDNEISLKVSFEFGGERSDACKKFIAENSDSVLAARYLDPFWGFFFAKAVKENFDLPCSLPDEKDSSKMLPDEIIIKIARYDLPLALNIWKWLVDEFSPYIDFEELSGEILSDGIFDARYSFPDPDEMLTAVIQLLHDDRDFCKKVASVNKEYSPAITDFIAGALEAKYYTLAAYLFKTELDKAKNNWKDVNKFIDYVICQSYCCGKNNVEALEFFYNCLLPLVKEISDDMVQDEIPEFEKETQEFIDRAQSERRQEEYERIYEKCRWRLSYVNKDCAGLNPENYETEDELITAIRAKREEFYKAKREEEQAKYLSQRQERLEKLEEAAKDKTLYTVCGVLVPNTERIYHYLTDDETIIPGDKVLVPFGSKELNGTVVSVGQYMNVGSPYPVDKMKKIINKVEE